MVIIPLTGKSTWKKPPIITILIILVNCLVYFGFQAGEDAKHERAINYYFDSGLAEIEFDRYNAYLEASGRLPDRLPRGNAAAMSARYYDIAFDVDFQEKLRSGEIIIASDPDYEQWKMLHDEYEGYLAAVVTLRYGFRPAYHRPVTFITSMFMHGGLMHLIGNMVFLWLAGCVLEIGCGRLQYALGYIVAGFGATSLFWLFNANSGVPCIGASGAISGLMGAYAVVYGRTQVSFFVTLGFYFNTVKLPGIVLLPLWVGNELFQYFFGGVSNTAYMAHVGGLLSGALLGWAHYHFSSAPAADVFSEEPVDDVPALQERALACMTKFDFEQARKLLLEVLEKRPDNQQALQQLYAVDKQDPGSTRYHETTVRLLASYVRTSPHNAHELYKEYLQAVGRPRFSAELALRVATLCIGLGKLDDGLQLLKALVRQRQQIEGLSTCLFRLASAYREQGNEILYKQCRDVIVKQYPDSLEARMLQQ